MKTLEKFECCNCIIKIEMQTRKEIVSDFNKKLYKVSVTPKRLNSWAKYEREFNYSREACRYFLDEVKYWLI